ncbi:hypothetical protein IWW38_000283 [Coemansia aciculifera]|uniref:Uncharacterized protein n=1 Tax=Coemansia aciculifera TaxID=417176 RepID=A0ACC1MBK3_9FUNG|nr:hypothetical protein IWW38_000283 [Coemansia aciculifera]
MHRTKQETSASLVSLPMLPRPSTGGGGGGILMAAAPLGVGPAGGNFKRPRVNSKALGSLFRAKAQQRDSIIGGSEQQSPQSLQQEKEASWNVAIDYPSAMSPLFSDESLQQLLGSSPQLTAVAPEGLALSPASRRSKREIAASVLQTSTGPFRRLRPGSHGKTMSYPPPPADEFVVVTPDMCPPASLVSSSVISGVSGSVRVRAQTHVIERLAYADSTESLVPVSAPSLSASSSEVSLALRRRGRGTIKGDANYSDRRLTVDIDGSHVAYTDHRLSHVARLECLSPYTVSRLSNTAARATERRRRSSTQGGRRSRASSASNATEADSFWRERADSADCWAEANGDDDDDDAPAFPSSSSAHFDVPMSPHFDTPMSPRHHTTRSADEIRLARDLLLDPSSLAYANAALFPPADKIAAALECVDELSDVPQSPCFSDSAEFDGSTLTQASDWLLMNASSSDGENAVQPLSVRPRRLRKRRVLPKTILFGSEAMKSCDTLRETAAASAVEPIAVIEPITAVIPIPPQEFAPSVPRLPLSICLHMPGLGRLALLCSGDSWQPLRIPHFSLQLSACIERMPALVDLQLINVGLTAVPPRLAVCQGLQRLDLSHNWISSVPGFLARLPHLSHIRMPGNPVRLVSADLVEMRHRLASLHLGRYRHHRHHQPWAVDQHRRLPLPNSALLPTTPEARADLLHARLRRLAQRRMAQCIDAPRLCLTQRQHDAQVARATKLLAVYSNALYSSLREPRSWGHSVALPRPTATIDYSQCP